MALAATSDLVLLAPVKGWAAPLAEVPDPVFAQKMMGDGVAIDPIGAVLCAPCDGEIILLHAAGHAVTLRAGNGAEILMHVGLDTVALAGKGFTAHVRQGDKVKTGAPLISFDLDQLARLARSLIIPIIVTNGEKFAITERVQGRGVAQGEKLMVLRAQAVAAPSAMAASRKFHRAVRVPLAHGIHARPAARLSALAKSFSAEIMIEHGGRQAAALSPVSLMALGLTKNAEALVIASGVDAEQAVAALAALIESGMGELDAPAPMSVTGTGPVRAAPGLALGIAVHFTRPKILVTETGQGMAVETGRLQRALAAVRAGLGKTRGAGAAIMAAHLAFLDDPALAAAAARFIANGKSAGFAWRQAIAVQTDMLRGLDDARLAERAADLTDLERQVLIALGEAPTSSLRLPENAILLADDLLPSEFLALGRLAGIATAKGGPTSHMAILAAAANIPTLVACGSGLHDIADGTLLLLDADHGALMIGPSDGEQKNARARIDARHARRAAAREKARAPGQTSDGIFIAVHANLASLEEAAAAVTAGAEGCGLLRTEFLFLNRATPPSEDEQADIYRGIARALDGRPLTIRTLDIGGDKPAAYLPFPAEENPALGLRGVRVSLWRPDLLKTQLRAILRGAPSSRVMVPMITGLEELRAVRRVLDQARAELGVTDKTALGAMVETPAAAITADLLAAEADFLSIGSNDLTQYALAMDRGNDALAGGFDALHPAVLRLIFAATEGAAKHDCPVAVCGGLASDPIAAPLLAGLGVRSLSATPAQIGEVKAMLAERSLEECQSLARRALGLSSPAAVRELLLGEK